MDSYEKTNTVNLSDGITNEKVKKKSSEKRFNRIGGACCIHFLIMNFISIVVSIIIVISGTMSGNSADELMEMATSSKSMLITMLVSYLIANISSTIIALAFIKRTKHSAKLMFSKPEISLKYILLGIPATMFLQSVSIVLQSIFAAVSGSSGIESMQMPELIKGDYVNNILYVAYVVFIGPVTEEIFFRGAVMKGLNFAGRKFAIVFSAILFAFFHGNIMQGIITFLLGVFFGYLDMKAGSIIPSVILHITNNATAALLSYIEYKSGAELSSSFVIIYITATVLIGVAAMLFLLCLLRKKEMSQNAFFAPEISVSKTEAGKYGFKSVVKCPFVWMIMIIYGIYIVVNII